MPHDTPAAPAPHWETSVYPLIITAGLLVFLPLAFVFKFVYHQPFVAVLCLGVGAPVMIYGIAGWVREAIGGEHGEGLAFPAMGWFILAEAMIFVSFFASYWFMRLNAGTWPPVGSVPMPVVLPLVMTAALVLSSITIHLGEAQLERGDQAGFRRWLMLTVMLGLGFLSMSIYEWSHLFHLGFNFETNAYSTIFYTITGFHGSHVLVGLGIFVAILIPALRGRINHHFVRTGALYWHFVDLIWFFVVSQVYFW
ncbi:MAG: heme-copper oxidase subunit III [Betaproteobacteria bacterium]|nr:heme-copper oxidase subunit III [Betaproteobacteria bacterium]